MTTTTVTARTAGRAGGRANTLLWAAQIVPAAFFASAAAPKLAVAMTVPLCAAFTLIAACRRAQIKNLAAAVTRR
jgi:hypothetical protein